MRIEVERTDANPLIAADGLDHWACSLVGDGEPVRFVVSLDPEVFGRGAPDDETVVDLIGADMGTLLTHPDPDEWLAEFSLDDDVEDERAAARREIERVRDGILAAFGPETVEAIVEGTLLIGPSRSI